MSAFIRSGCVAVARLAGILMTFPTAAGRLFPTAAEMEQSEPHPPGGKVQCMIDAMADCRMGRSEFVSLENQMGRQIRFYLCDAMRAAIQSEAQRIGAMLVTNYSSVLESIQFSDSHGNDSQQGRLWTQSPDTIPYDSIRRAVKRGAGFDNDTGLWVKRESRAQFEAYKKSKEKALAELVDSNRKYVSDVLGASVKRDVG